MKADILLGLQWGDEGKGKVVDVLTPRYDIIARFQGGPNAGHTIEFNGNKFVLHTIPSGIFNPDTINVIGNGVIIDPFIFSKEIENLSSHHIDTGKNLLISKKAHLILPTHRMLDAAYEKAKGDAKIGSTLKGIGPAYTDKTARNGFRVGNLNRPDFKQQYDALRQKHFQILKSFDFDYQTLQLDGLSFDQYETKWFEALGCLKGFQFIDSEYFINKSLDENKRVLAEGAQGTMLDVDFGTYPFVTSSNTISAGVCTGLGIAPHRIGEVFGIFKAYCTRVGSGPFPTELNNDQGQQLRDIGSEYGATTGRPRRCGWMDMLALKYAIMLNGVSKLIMTKADVLNTFDEISIGIGYKMNEEVFDHVPFNASYDPLEAVYKTLPGWNSEIISSMDKSSIPVHLKSYIAYIEKETGVEVNMVSMGPDRNQVIEF